MRLSLLLFTLLLQAFFFECYMWFVVVLSPDRVHSFTVGNELIPELIIFIFIIVLIANETFKNIRDNTTRL